MRKLAQDIKPGVIRVKKIHNNKNIINIPF
jgi:hypothetical protein